MVSNDNSDLKLLAVSPCEANSVITVQNQKINGR